MRLLLAFRAALAAFLASWRGTKNAFAPALGPYRTPHKLPCETPATPDDLVADDGSVTWAEARRDLTAADLRAMEARRQHVIVEKPLERLAHHQGELARLRAEADAIRTRANPRESTPSPIAPGKPIHG